MEGWVLATVYATIAMVVGGFAVLAFVFNPLLCLVGIAALGFISWFLTPSEARPSRQNTDQL